MIWAPGIFTNCGAIDWDVAKFPMGMIPVSKVGCWFWAGWVRIGIEEEAKFVGSVKHIPSVLMTGAPFCACRI